MRAVAGVAARHSALRTFATTAQYGGKVPSMSDSSAAPDEVELFNKRQSEFRKQLVEQQKQREASAWSNNASSTSTSSSSSTSSPDASLSQAQALGSLKNTAEQKAQVEDPPRKPGRLTNLIYGTKEGRELDAQLAASFSQVLARGKYVHTITFHEVKPDKVEEYVDLVGYWYPKMASLPENKVHLVGSWRTEVGDCNTFGRSFCTLFPACRV